MHLLAPPPGLAAFALATAAIAFLAGLARGFSGFGAAMVFIPVASATLGPVVAAPVLLVADLVMAIPLLRPALAHCSLTDIKRVALGALIGFPVGVQILTSTDPTVVRWTTSLLILCALAVMISGWRYQGEHSPPITTGVGLTSGIMSGLAQMGGPPVVIYWLGTDMAPARIRANLIIYFALLTVFGLFLFAAKGLVTARVVWLAAAAAPGYGIGIWAGTRLFPFASERTFKRIAFALIALAAVVGLPLLDPWIRSGVR